jgi:hypothetical protein
MGRQGRSACHLGKGEIEASTPSLTPGFGGPVLADPRVETEDEFAKGPMTERHHRSEEEGFGWEEGRAAVEVHPGRPRELGGDFEHRPRQ